MAKKKDITALIKEATQHVEDELSLEDRGWLKFGSTADTVDPASRVKYVGQSRLYSVFDPLCCQAIRLWTSYAFGTGMTWNTVTDSATEKALLEFYDNNRSMLSAAGQRKSSDKYLVDGEVFFALFIGNGGSNPTSIRRIDPLEITEIISDPDDIEDVRYYKREWTDAQAKVHVGYYRSYLNVKDEKSMDMYGAYQTSTEDALIYHVSGGIGQRGVPLLLPALDWAYEYRRFLASRIAVVLALAQFAWKNKIDGSAATVAAAKAQIDTQKRDHSAKTIVENAGANWEPIKTDTGAGNAYTDGRMIKLMIFAATGFPEQYFSDVSVGNLATAKSVELPVSKMIQDYQQMWHDVYADIHGIVLQGAGIETPDEVDIDFPLIAPEDTVSLATSISALVAAFPGFGDLSAVQQQALNALGVEDVAGAIEELEGLDAQAEAKIEAEKIPPIIAEPKFIEALKVIKARLLESSNDKVC